MTSSLGRQAHRRWRSGLAGRAARAPSSATNGAMYRRPIGSARTTARGRRTPPARAKAVIRQVKPSKGPTLKKRAVATGLTVADLIDAAFSDSSRAVT